jgi:uncharacterized membrane protein
MPHQWLPPTGEKATLQLWPYRSLPRRGMVWFIAITAALVSLPLLILLGSQLLWGILPFITLAVAGVWWALERNYKDAEILEVLTLSATEVTLTRTGPRGRRQTWQANPHWVRVILHPKDGPVLNYLTLQGGPREVELGAFLTPDERLALLSELKQALATQH